MFYSDSDFAAKIDEKLGNIKYFKKCMRDYGLIGARKQLSDEHFTLFEEIRNYRNAENCEWDRAMNDVLRNYAKDSDDDEVDSTEGLLREILKTLQRIEQNLNTSK